LQLADVWDVLSWDAADGRAGRRYRRGAGPVAGWGRCHRAHHRARPRDAGAAAPVATPVGRPASGLIPTEHQCRVDPPKAKRVAEDVVHPLRAPLVRDIV